MASAPSAAPPTPPEETMQVDNAPALEHESSGSEDSDQIDNEDDTQANAPTASGSTQPAAGPSTSAKSTKRSDGRRNPQRSRKGGLDGDYRSGKGWRGGAVQGQLEAGGDRLLDQDYPRAFPDPRPVGPSAAQQPPSHPSEPQQPPQAPPQAAPAQVVDPAPAPQTTAAN